MFKKKITVLHLSDMQFGRHHRFAGIDSNRFLNRCDTLIARLRRDLDVLSDTGVKPDIIVVTGDISEWALPSEFQLAGKFFEQLREHLRLDVSRIAVVPGNHDVNRKLCKAYWLECEGWEREPQPPWFPKWRPFCDGLGKYLNNSFSEEHPWSLFEIPELKVVVAGLNSTMEEGHDERNGPPHHRGFLGEEQLRWFEKHLEQRREDGWLRLGVVHHNFNRGDDDESFLKDRKTLIRILGGKLNALLHGHTHEETIEWVTNLTPVLSTGSAGVELEERPVETPNQYQIFEFRETSLRRIARGYIPEQQKWASDPRIGTNRNPGIEEFSITFQDVKEAFSSSQSPKTSSPGFQYSKASIQLDAHESIRVSIAAILRLELDGGFLLVANIHRPNTFGPFGGVFKILSNSKAKLQDLGFTPEYDGDVGDRVRDLRGYISYQNLARFREWFMIGKGRELAGRCLRRELREELNEVQARGDLISETNQLEFSLVRVVEESPSEFSKQYRRRSAGAWIGRGRPVWQ